MTTGNTTFTLDGHKGVQITVELTPLGIAAVQKAMTAYNGDENKLYMSANFKGTDLDTANALAEINDLVMTELSAFAEQQYIKNWEQENPGRTFDYSELDEDGYEIHDLSDITEGYFLYGYAAGDKSDIQRVTEDLYAQCHSLPRKITHLSATDWDTSDRLWANITLEDGTELYDELVPRAAYEGMKTTYKLVTAEIRKTNPLDEEQTEEDWAHDNEDYIQEQYEITCRNEAEELAIRNLDKLFWDPTSADIELVE